MHQVFGLPHTQNAMGVLFPKDAGPVGPLPGPGVHNRVLGLACGAAMAQGKRSYMEDRLRVLPEVLGAVDGLPDSLGTACFFGVFDGHGGSRGRVGDEVAEYLMTHLPHRLFHAMLPAVDRYRRANGLEPLATEDILSPIVVEVSDPAIQEPAAQGLSSLQRLADAARRVSKATLVDPDFHRIATGVFRRFDEEVMSQGFLETAGSTCTVATLFGDALVVMNVGDSDAVLCRAGEPRRLSVQHKAADPSEAQRIVNAGGSVQNVMGVWRVAGMLEVSAPPPLAPAPPRPRTLVWVPCSHSHPRSVGAVRRCPATSGASTSSGWTGGSSPTRTSAWWSCVRRTSSWSSAPTACLRCTPTWPTSSAT